MVDDIHIRSVHNFFEFLRHDAMFELEEVAHTTAFFTRTQAPVFDPLGDSWWTQRYNAKPLLRYTWKERFKTSIPDAVFERLSRFRRRTKAGECAIEIHSPRENEVVGKAGVPEGSASLTPGAHLWILVRRNSPFAHALRSCRSFLGIHFEVDQGYDWSQTGNSVTRPLSAGGVE